MLKLVLIGVSSALVGSAFAQSNDAEILRRARTHITQKLKDPFSAVIADAYVVRQGKAAPVVCGTINAKNSFGGYVGARPFFYVDAKEPGGAIEGEPFFVAFEAFCKR